MSVGVFLQQQLIGLWQDYRNWWLRVCRWQRGLSDLLAGRATQERTDALRSLRVAGAIAVLTVFLYTAGHFLPEGYDWKCCFSQRLFPSFYVPWTLPLVSLLNLPLLFTISVLGLGLRLRRYHAPLWIMALAFVSLPTLWLLFLGTIDGFALIVLVLLPIGVPLVLIKPQLASFALLANRRSLFVTIVWVLLSFIVWGLWPLGFIGIGDANWRAGWPQDISLFPWGLLVALPLMWLSRGDEDMLMAAGSFGTPHLFPYHFVVLMPALARMDKFWAILSWVFAWTPLLANYFGPMAWHFGNLTSVSLWLGLYFRRRALATEAGRVAADVANRREHTGVTKIAS